MQEDFRKSPPTPLAPVAFNIPKPFETTLQNGLKVVVFQDRRLPLVSFRLIFQAGDAHEPMSGLNSAMAALLNEGTENYSSKTLAEEVERLGASLGAGAGADTTRVSASCLSLYVPDILRLMEELVLKPNFPENELRLYQQNTIEGLKFQRSQASFLANEQTARIIYGEHPYGIISPSAEDIEQITRPHLLDHHAKTFIPNNAVLIVVGDVEKDEILQEINDKFGSWQAGEAVSLEFPVIPERRQRTLTIVDRKGSAQANIVLANPAIRRNHPDFFAVLVMNQILGAGASSRVFMNLREEKGYTYGAYTKFDMKRLAGEFEATAEVRTSVAGDSLHEFFFELDRIRDERVSNEELQDAKNYLTGVFPIRAETQEGLTNLLVQQQIYKLPDDYLQTYRTNISEVTAEEVNRVAQIYIQPEKIAVIIVGDAGELLPQVKDYADQIEIFDTEGNSLKIEDFAATGENPASDVSGNWKLLIDFQGKEVPVTLTLQQNDNQISGKLESMIGEGRIDNGKVAGNNFSAAALIMVQGQTLEISITGTLENDQLSGILSAPMFPQGLTFKGAKEN